MKTAIAYTLCLDCWPPGPVSSPSKLLRVVVGPVMGEFSSHSDADLVKACLSGNEPAWDEFYCRYLKTVRSVVRRRLGVSVQEAEDVAQDVFASLIPALKTYNPSQPLKPFVCTVAERTCIAEYRKATTAKRDAPTDPIDHHGSGEAGMANPVSRVESPEESVSREQLVSILRAGLRSLRDKCREVLRLRYFEELSFKEIGETFGETDVALRIRAKRCLDDLRAVCLKRLKGGRSR